ncbi:hypothetical protein H4R19_000064 [Coemansia spiralis]|nr:hypothetical protein H4R19_000064 [Coemansia spiralis]
MVNERVLVQECMFAGQRQRRGMNKVDEYLTKLKDPAFYLNSSIDDEGLESVTPFYITSSMVWDTVRRVFAAAKAAALTEIAFVKACSEQSQSTESKLADPSSDYQSKTLLLRTKSIYARIFLSGPRNLLRATDVELASSLDAPTRRTRGLPGRRPEYTHLTARPRTGPARRPREPNHTAEWATQFSSVAGHPPGPNDAGPNDAGPNDAPADPHPLTQIGPAHLVVEKTTRKQAQRTGRQQSRGSSKKTNLALQGADVAAMNSSVRNYWEHCASTCACHTVTLKCFKYASVCDIVSVM